MDATTYIGAFEPGNTADREALAIEVVAQSDLLRFTPGGEELRR